MVNKHIRKAARIMREGGVIAYPTEGVWGLGCDPFDPVAVNRILRMKQRSVDKGLILVAASIEQIEPLLATVSKAQRQQLEDTWPGPTTWLLPDPDQRIPPWIKGKFATVALRVSDHPVVQSLCRAFGGPIVSTSANPGERPPALKRLRVLTWFGGQLDYVVPGRLGGRSGPSTIRELGTDKVIR